MSAKQRRRRFDDTDTPLDPWRHVVLAATFFYLVLEAGTLKSLGVLIPSLVFQLQSSYATMGVICSLPWSVEYLCSIFIKLLAKRVDAHKLAITGGIIAGVALTVSAFVRSTFALGLLFFLVGFGQSMVVIPAMIFLHQHYDAQFPFAVSFAFIGALVGVLILPIITEIIMETYGAVNTLMLLGGLCLHMFPIGLVLKSPRIRPRTSSYVSEKLMDAVDRTSTKPDEVTNHFTNTDRPDICQADAVLRSKGDVITASTDFIEVAKRHNGTNKVMGQKEAFLFQQLYPVNEPENTAVGDCEELKHGHRVSDGCVDFEERNCELMNSISDGDSWERLSKGAKHVAALKMFLRKWKFYLLFALPCDFLTSFVFISYMIFVVPYAVSVGIEESRAVFMATIGGVGGVVVRTMNTAILRIRPTWGPHDYVLLSMLTSVILFLQPMRASYEYLLACSFMIGFGLYGSTALPEPILSLVVSPRDFPVAVSISYFFKGIAGILTTYVSGSLYDSSGSFQEAFYILGGVKASAVLLMSMLIFTKKWTKRNRAKSGTDNDVDMGEDRGVAQSA